MVIKEGVQLYHVGPDDTLTPSIIFDVLRKAQVNQCYAKFYTDKCWIQVNFNRDLSISVSSNIRNTIFTNDIWRIDREGHWDLYKVQAFVYKWMQLQRKLLY